jgi:DNA polymerase III delta prime subunit
MSDKVWNKVNSPKLEKILLPLKRIMKKLEFKPLKDKVKKKVDSL